jgi:hypothetical protein
VAKEIRGPADQTLLPSWAVCGSSCAIVGCLGAILGHVGLSWGHLGAILGCIGTILGTSLAILGSSWAILESCWPYWGYLGPSWGQLGHLGVPSWWIWRMSHAFCGVLGSTSPSWGAILADLEDLPCVLGGSGRFLRDVSHGLWGPVGRQSKA